VTCLVRRSTRLSDERRNTRGVKFHLSINWPSGRGSPGCAARCTRAMRSRQPVLDRCNSASTISLQLNAIFARYLWQRKHRHVWVDAVVNFSPVSPSSWTHAPPIDKERTWWGVAVGRLIGSETMMRLSSDGSSDGLAADLAAPTPATLPSPKRRKKPAALPFLTHPSETGRDPTSLHARWDSFRITHGLVLIAGRPRSERSPTEKLISTSCSTFPRQEKRRITPTEMFS